jgi:hypothetical protein
VNAPNHKSIDELTAAERELLAILAEEAAEVVQAATKILRFGPSRSYPDGTMNVTKLIEEWADMRATVDLLRACPAFREFNYAQWNRLMQNKSARIASFTENDWLREMALANADLFRQLRDQGTDR